MSKSALERLDADIRAPLDEFRSRYPPHHVQAGGRSWEVIVAGRGARTVLVLPGALGAAEAGWLTIARLANDGLRVVAPSTPPHIETMTALADAVVTLLDELELHQVALFGASYGGLLAQVLARRSPQRVSRMVLSHTGVAQPRRARRTTNVLRIYAKLPKGILQSMLARQVYRHYKWVNTPQARLHSALMQDIARQRIDKREILAGFRRVVEFDAGWTEQPGAAYAGPMLLIYGARDGATPRRVRESLALTYPQAEVHIFRGSGHATAFREEDAYYALVRKWAQG